MLVAEQGVRALENLHAVILSKDRIGLEPDSNHRAGLSRPNVGDRSEAGMELFHSMQRLLKTQTCYLF